MSLQHLDSGEIQYPDAYAAATRRAIIANAQKTFHKTHPEADRLVEYLRDNTWSDFARTLLDAYNTYGKLSEKQLDAIRGMERKSRERAVAKAELAAAAAAKAAALGYAYAVGAKVKLTLTVVRAFYIDHPKFHYYDSGRTLVRVMKCGEGREYCYRGDAWLSHDDRTQACMEGDVEELTFTVKSLGDYKGTPVTYIARPKLTKRTPPTAT